MTTLGVVRNQTSVIGQWVTLLEATNQHIIRRTKRMGSGNPINGQSTGDMRPKVCGVVVLSKTKINLKK